MGRRAAISLLVTVAVIAAASSSASAIINNITTLAGASTTTTTTTTTTRPAVPRAPAVTPGASRGAAKPPGVLSFATNLQKPPPIAAADHCLPFLRDGKADSNGIDAFGMNIFRHLVEEGNVFFSPYNLWSALALTYMGAEEETKLQMEGLLGVRGKKNTLEFTNSLEHELSSRFKGHQNLSLDTASKVYVQDGFSFSPCLKSSLSDRLQSIDFAMIGEAADTINGYVNASTRGLIKEIVTPGQLTNTKMAIVTAIYFYGAWESAFKPEFTSSQPFYPQPSSPTPDTVQMMRQKAMFSLGKSEDLKARLIRLPYKTDTVSMYVLLPNEEGSRAFDDTVRALNPTTLQAAIGGLKKTRVEVQLPKFKMEKEYMSNLKSAIKSLGATHMFDKNLANFSSFSPLLYVSTLAHKAVVDVSEEGTEAAAATAVLLDVRSSLAEARPFVCNRPFIFVIYDDVSRLTLFLGAFKNSPKA